MLCSDTNWDFVPGCSEQLVKLTKSSGRPLPDFLRQEGARLLGRELSDVVVHDDRLANNLCAAQGALALCVGNHIAFGAGAYRPDRPFGRAIIFHELAHVIQQRLGREGMLQSASRDQLEREADDAAIRLMNGRPFRCTLADSRGIPASWDIAGHYYTPYLLFLNAGVDPDVALRLSLWAWLPDQVEEFDAAHIGKRRFWYSAAWHHARDTFSNHDSRAYRDEDQYIATVQKGFHVLTGANAEDQTDVWRRRFTNAGPAIRPLFRGLMLHAFGDCFAHRDFDGSGDLYGKSAPFGHAGDGHDPDNIWDDHRAGIYASYVRGLARLASAYSNRSGRVSPDNLLVALSPMFAEGTEVEKVLGLKIADASPEARKLASEKAVHSERGCCDHIRKVASRLVGTSMASRHPDEESVPWEEYFARLRTWIVMDSGGRNDADLIFYEILKAAAEWSGESIPEKRPVPRIGRPQR